jgi:predicted PurR-regulated permease PerM
VLGILGAFLAVPVAAIAAQTIDLVRGREDEPEGAAEAESEAASEAANA